MSKLISISEVVEIIRADNGSHEVCAGAEADYDEAKNTLTVRLTSYVRATGSPGPEKQFSPHWLPRQQKVQEHVGREEAIDLAKDIFHGWVRRVRESISHQRSERRKL